MTIDPTNIHSSTSDLQRYSATDSIPRYSDSIINGLFSAIPEQLRELKVSGRDCLFSITENLLFHENDSSTQKAIKAFFHIIPVIPTIMVATSLIDNTFKVFKNDIIQQLDNDLLDHNASSEELQKELSTPLHYFSSERYEKLKTELELETNKVKDELKQTEQNFSEVKNRFHEKLREVRPSLNFHLKQSEYYLNTLSETLSDQKGFYQRIKGDIKNHKKIINNYSWFLNPSVTTIFSEIISPFTHIEKKMLQLSSKIDSEIESTLCSKIERFKEKIKGYSNDLKRVIEKIEDLEIKAQERECIEERLTLKTGSTEVTTYKTRQSEKENKVITRLNIKKSHLKEKIQNIADSYIKFLEKTHRFLEEDFLSAVIEKNKTRLLAFLRDAKSHLDSYEAKFPKQEKRDYKNLMTQINTSTNINELINKSHFRYQRELSKCQTLQKENSELIEKAINKLEELESLSKNSSLKHKYIHRLIKDSNLLKSTNQKLKMSYEKLLSYQRELFIYNLSLNSLHLHEKISEEERQYDKLSNIYINSSNELQFYKKPSRISEICSKIDSYRK